MNTTFDAVNARAAAIGQVIFHDIVKNKDIESLQQLRNMAVELYAGLRAMAKTVPSYDAWHAMFIKMNVDAPFNQLDTTGEYTKLVEELKTIDAQAYYAEVVAPLLAQGPDAFDQERDRILSFYDAAIAYCQ